MDKTKTRREQHKDKTLELFEGDVFFFRRRLDKSKDKSKIRQKTRPDTDIDKARQDKIRHNKTRQDKTQQDKTQQDKHKTRQTQDKTNTRQDKARQAQDKHKTRQDIDKDLEHSINTILEGFLQINQGPSLILRAGWIAHVVGGSQG